VVQQNSEAQMSIKTPNKTNAAKAASAVAFLSIQLFASVGFCAIPYALRSSLIKNFDFAPQAFDFSKGFDGADIQPIQSDRGANSADVAKVIPANMQPTTDQTKVASQILDHSVSAFFDSDAIKRSDMGRTAKQVEQSMQTEQSFGSGEPNSIKHSVKFSMKATESRADIEYTGLTNAQMTYYVAQTKTNLEVREPVKALGTNLVYNNIISPGETRNTLSVRWAF
jgi:hypothetical protein